MTLRSADASDLQLPRIMSVAPAVTTAGPEAAEFARRVGVQLDAWQLMGLDAVLGQDANADWAAAETCTVAGRQTGKNGLVEPVELYGLFMLDEAILHTAHRLDASRGSHERLWQMIKRDPVLLRRVEKRRTANEEQSILLDTGAKIEFTVRSDEGARSKTYDRIVVDEAFAATPGQMGAVGPTLISKANWQINYLSSAGMARSAVLHELRKRGIAGARGLTYLEWSADPDEYRRDPVAARRNRRLLRMALPALGGRLAFETIEKLASALPAAEFDREVLCIWDEPEVVVDRWAVFTESAWRDRADAASQPMDPVAFAVEVLPDRSRTRIGVAGWRQDGRRHVELVEDRAGTAWAPKRLAELARQWDPCAVALNGAGPTATMLPELAAVGLEPMVATARQMAASAGAFFDGIRDDDVRYRPGPHGAVLDAAAEAARKRPLAGAWAFAHGPEEPVTAVSVLALADYALAVHGRPGPGPATPQAVAAVGTAMSETSDLARMGF